MSAGVFGPLATREPGSARQLDVDPDTWETAHGIVKAVRQGGEPSLRDHAERLDQLEVGASLVWTREDMRKAYESLRSEDRDLLQTTADRIRGFALAQRATLTNLDVAVPGGRAGQRVIPMQAAGCYAPGGRFPLPSSVLMTVIPARAAGVQTVWVASPNPQAVTAAAAHVAKADGLLAAGGAQAIAAMAYGIGPCPRCDIVVGPGNRYVTAAKQIVSASVAIDMLAGPSELVVVADDSAAPEIVAADLLAQAEHDPDAWPVLITTSPALVEHVVRELETQLATLPTADNARAALKNGGYVLASGHDEALALCDELAAEHVELLVREPHLAAERVSRYGGLFVGAGSAEVFGDYGVGPNHVLPTGGTGRFKGGLSVLDFLSVRTWLSLSEPASIATGTARLARLEGLEAHARSAEARGGASG